MTDNTDLLGAADVPAKPRRGRPAKLVPLTPVEAAAAAPPATSQTATSDLVLDGASPVLSDATKAASAAAISEIIDTVGDGFTGYRPVPNTDGSTSVELPEVSADYQLAQAKRVRIIGQTSRDYAYKRILRTGKRL